MKVRELKEKLNSLSEDDLDLEVRVWADHGQTSMEANEAGVDWIDEDTYMAEPLHPDDVTEDSVKIYAIYN